MDPGASAGTTFTVHTDVFDGPLDLLLHLVKRDGIALRRLDVSRIADSYLAYLDQMRALDLSIAADWLVMAATLVHLKSLELLPRPPAILSADEPDPRDALLDQLRDYEKLRAAATELDGLAVVGRDVFVRTGERAPDTDRPLASPVDAFGLLDILFHVLSRGSAPEPMVRLGDSGPNITACCLRVLGVLGGLGGTTELSALLRTIPTRVERVVTFVATLEMARLGWLDVGQLAHLGPIRVEQLVPDEAIDVAYVMGDALRPATQLELPLAEPT